MNDKSLRERRVDMVFDAISGLTKDEGIQLLSEVVDELHAGTSRRLVESLWSGRQRRRARGEVYASEAPVGFTVSGDKLVEDAREAAAVKHIRELRAQGMSYLKIQAQLEAEDIRPRRGARWSLAMLHRIVTGKRAPAKRKSTLSDPDATP